MQASQQPKIGRVVQAGEAYLGKQGLSYTPGISAATVGSRALWVGSAVLPPGGRTKAHIHENHESAFDVMSGDEVELWTGEDLNEKAVAHAGDYLYIPGGCTARGCEPRRHSRAVCGSATHPNERESVVMRPDLESRVP